MAELILNIFDDNLVPIETAICLSVVEYTSCPMKITLMKIQDDTKSCQIKYKLLDNTVGQIRREKAERKMYTTLPAIVMDEGSSYVAGLAAVLREIVRRSSKKFLLGFRDCCLAAPAEVSCWTRFCEVDVVHCLKNLLLLQPQVVKSRDDANPVIEDLNGENNSHISLFGQEQCEIESNNYHYCYLPEELATLEYHLSIPAKVHNRRKYGINGPNHNYVEGPHMVVSDLVIALCIHLILDYLRAYKSAALPFTLKWLDRIKSEGGFGACLERICNTNISTVMTDVWLLPKLKNGPVDLYKKEGTRRKKIFTQGDLLSDSLEVISEVSLMEYKQLCDPYDLESIDVILPDVPEERLERKTQQLKNLAVAALQISKENDIIVDLCCGSGHLGILLATLLPSCTIILLDNKEKSLERAKQRIKEINLTNVKIVQSNLDYFIGEFQVGVSLHACGVASDLVIKKCLNSKAHLVLCPCCYGGIQSNHMVKYPQSSTFQDTFLREHDFFVLAHNADTYDTEEGRLAMTAVDTDRCLYLSQHNYSVRLSKLHPPDCTTRNNLIVAVYSS